MADDQMQLQRWELKYVIPEDVALAVRDFVRPYLELDEYGAKRPDLSYTIHNLYLDSEDLEIYWGTINGDKNRYKLRLRFYEDNPQAPIFFEIKRRMNEAILKQRGGVKRVAVDSVLGGQLPAVSELVSGDPRQLSAIQRFVELAMHHRAGPVAHVRYEREAWISLHDNSVRVTLDRDVQISPEFVTRFTEQMDEPISVFGRLVILELKFTGRFPDWFKEMVRIFHLRHGSASKYADGIARRGEVHFQARGDSTLQKVTFHSAARRDGRLTKIDRLSLTTASS
jgi:VTC domain